MATSRGQKFSGSVSLASEEVFDFVCSPCARDNNNKEAVTFCTACEEYFCKTCVEFHNKFRATSDHRNRLFNQAEMKKRGPQKPRATITEKCELHGDKLVDMFCPYHDTVGCNTCMTVDHRSCKDVDFIPLIVKGITKSSDIQKIKTDLEKAKKEMTKMKSSRQKDQSRISKEKNDALTTIKEFRRKMNSILDKLEKSATDDVDNRYKNLNTRIQEDIGTCDDIIAAMESLIKKFETDKTNEPQVFVNVKKGKQIATNAEKVRAEMVTSVGRGKETSQFTIDKSIEAYLNNLKSLGKFPDESDQHSSTEDSQVKVRMNSRNQTNPVADQVEGRINSGNPDVRKVQGRMNIGNPNAGQVQRRNTNTCRLYKASGGRDVNIKIKNDNYTCNIIGSCHIPSGGTLITDYANQSLKQLDSSYKVISQCDLSGRPSGVCMISANEAAVALDYNTILGNTIQFVSVQEMRPSRSIQLDHSCYGVAYSNGELYVSDGGYTVHVHTLTGAPLSTYRTDQSGQKIFSSTHHMAVSGDGDRLYVADNFNGLICLDKQGRVLWTVTDPRLNHASGVCVDQDDNVLVCGYHSHNVLHVSREGEVLGEVVTQADGLSNPQTVCYDQINSTLMVTMRKNNHVRVFDLKLGILIPSLLVIKMCNKTMYCNV